MGGAGKRAVEAHYAIGQTQHHHRHSSAIRLRGRRQDIVLCVVPGLHHCIGVHKELSDLIEVFSQWRRISRAVSHSCSYPSCHPHAKAAPSSRTSLSRWRAARVASSSAALPT